MSTAAPSVLGPLAHPAPELAALFVPAAAPSGIYTVYVSAEPIERMAARLRALDPAPQADAWRVLATEPVFAFGSEGRYDPGRMARLFSGKRPRVARGMLREGAAMTAFTLVSPIPDSRIETLQNETLIIVTDVGRLLREAAANRSAQQ